MRDLIRRAPGPLLIVAGIVVALVAWFAIANSTNVRVNFWVISKREPLFVVIIVSFLFGVVLGRFGPLGHRRHHDED